MALSKPIEPQTKFVTEYKDSTGKVTDRWHYDLNKFRNGPILVENLDLPLKKKLLRRKS
jgi:hypothetical protein